MAELTVNERLDRLERFVFHGVHPHAHFGTASDRYAGWIGQIYSDAYRDQVKSRRRRLGAQTFDEQTVPIESAGEYFDHFDVLEIDFTFYRPLLEDDKPTSNFFVLQQYADAAPGTARFLLKAPQPFFARRVRRARAGKSFFEENPRFLDAAAYTRDFHRPALDLLGGRLSGIVFEQEYQRKTDGPDPIENVVELDGFFRKLPDDVQAHLEIRSPHLLVPPYFDWLQNRGLGFVFSHWSWLPPIREQWKLCGGAFSARDRSAVARLLTPLRVTYEKAYAMTHPFDRPVEAISELPTTRQMILDVTALIYQAEAQGAVLNIITNNRAYGNAPELGRNIARRALEEEERRRQ